MRMMLAVLAAFLALPAQDTSGTGSLRGRLVPPTSMQVCLQPGPCEMADATGNFRFATLRPGRYTLMVNRQQVAIEVQAGRETDVEIVRAELQPQQQSIEVRASSVVAPEEARSSVHLIESAEVNSSAAAMKDVSRHLQTLPGVMFGGVDLMNEIVVRGGSPLENLFVVDNIEIPNINHFASFVTAGGMVGQFNSELLDGMTFLTGGYPAAYSNRLSSVLQITQRDGSRERLRAQGTVGMAGAGGIAEGPVGSKGAWIVSMRRSFYDLVTDDLGFGGVPVYTNAQAKFVYDFNAAHRVWLSSLGGRDNVSIRPKADKASQESDPFLADFSGWRNGAGVNWQHLFGARGVGLLGLTHSHAQVNDTMRDVRLNNATVSRERSSEDEMTVKYDLTLQVPGLDRLQAGANIRRLRTDYFMAAPLGSENPFTLAGRVNSFTLAEKLRTGQQSAYAQFSRPLTRRLSITAGGRYDRYALLDRVRFSPRVGLTWRLTERFSAHASAGRYHQQPLALLVAVTPENRGLAPMRADHLVAGVTWQPSPTLRLTMEAYAKRYGDYPVSLEYPQITLAAHNQDYGVTYLLIPYTSAGWGRAKGVEWQVEKKFTRRWYGQTNLALASARHAGLDGVLRPGGYDARYVWNAAGGYRPGGKWEFAARYVAMSGRPRTPLDVAASRAQNRGIFDLTQVNGIRAEGYRRLDLRVDRTFEVRGGALNVYFGAQNALGRKNFMTEIWNFRRNEPKRLNQMGLFPLLGCEWRFR